MFGWILLAYFVIGTFAIFFEAGKIIYDLCQQYDSEIVFDVANSYRESAAFEDNQFPLRVVIGIILWPSRLANFKTLREAMKSECEFQTRINCIRKDAEP